MELCTRQESALSVADKLGVCRPTLYNWKNQLLGRDQSIEDAKSAHAADDVTSIYDAGRRFRDAWLAAVKNARLAASITRYGDQVALVRRVTLHDPVRQKDVIAAYEELRHAFKQRDSIGAHDSMMPSFIQRNVISSP